MTKRSSILNEGTRVDLQIKNIYAIAASLIITAFVVGVSWSNLSNRIDLLSQKVDLLISNQNKIINDIDSRLAAVETRQRDGLNRLAIVETRLNDSRVTTQSKGGEK